MRSRLPKVRPPHCRSPVESKFIRKLTSFLHRAPCSYSRLMRLLQTVPIVTCIFWMISCTQAPRPAAPDRPNLQIGGGNIYLHIDGQSDKLSQEDLERWVRTAANAAANYFGHFPVKQVDIEITVGGPGKVNGGVTYGGRRIAIRVGRQALGKDLQQDWRL